MRMVFDPYLDRNIEVRLTDSVPFAAEDGQTPDWVIEFQPNSPECETWDEVFSIRERIKRDVLDQSFRRWLREFATWFKRRVGNPAPDKTIVLNAVDAYSEDMADLGLNAREFLRAPVFRMLHHHCANGDDRLSDLMIDLVSVEGAG